MPGGTVNVAWNLSKNKKAPVVPAQTQQSCTVAYDRTMAKPVRFGHLAKKQAKAQVLAQVKKKLPKYGRIVVHVPLTALGKRTLRSAKRHHQGVRGILVIRYTP